jgi:hypothetical protein
MECGSDILAKEMGATIEAQPYYKKGEPPALPGWQ